MYVNEFIDILDFNETNLKSCFKSDDCVLDRKFKIPYDHHFFYFYRYLTKLNCKSIIFEKEYTDRDYIIDYSNYYARCHKEYKRKCSRMHFLNKAFVTEKEKKELVKILLGKKSTLKFDELQESYLGCAVAKPLPETIIGTTLLKPYDNNIERKITCLKQYTAHLSNLEFKINTLAFQEQDSVCAACATSSLWSAFHEAESIFPQISSPPPVEITKLATKYFFGSRPFPSGGLTVWQMCQAIHEVGLGPHVRGGDETEESLNELPLLSLMYSYLCAGVPVILNALVTSPLRDYGFHSMVLLGYKLNNNRIYTKESSDEPFLLKGARITSFYCHDDQLGPFCEIELKGPFKLGRKLSRNKLIIPVTFKNPLKDRNEDKWDLIIPSTVIIPLYSKIRLVFLTVYEMVKKINRWLEAYNLFQPKTIEWDIYLITNNKFKENIIQDNKYRPYLKELLTKPFPRFIWVVSANYNDDNLFELIIDATDMERSYYFLDALFFNDSFKTAINRISTDQQSIDQYSILLTKKFLELLAEASN